MPFISSDSSKDLTGFMISSIYSFEIISAVVCGAKFEGCRDPKSLFWIAASVADPATNVNGIKTLLASGMSTFFTNGKSTDINLRKLKKPPS